MCLVDYLINEDLAVLRKDENIEPIERLGHLVTLRSLSYGYSKGFSPGSVEVSIMAFNRVQQSMVRFKSNGAPQAACQVG